MRLRTARLWTNKCLELPSSLMDAYHRQLARLGLPATFPARLAKYGRGQRGGSSKEDAEAHYATMFAGGAARPILVYIDPERIFEEPGRAIRERFVEGRLVLVDAPCGAGCTSLSVLAYVAHLRTERVLATAPLSIVMFAADISAPSRDLLGRKLAELQPALQAAAIEVEIRSRDWDISDTHTVLRAANELAGSSSAETPILVLVGAFSEALRQNFATQFATLGAQLTTLGRATTIVWIEPAETKGFNPREQLRRLAVQLGQAAGRLGLVPKLTDVEAPLASAKYAVRDPIEGAGSFDASIVALCMQSVDG